MLDYAFLKTLHIISATLLFGTGLGTFFFMIRACRSGNLEAIRVTAATVVLADWYFTTPAVLVQFASGLALMHILHISLLSAWFKVVIGLFCFVGALWLPVVYIQLQLRQIIADHPADQPLPERFSRQVRRWEMLGYPAFSTMILIFGWMVYKPWIA